MKAHSALPKGLANLLIGVVLAQGIHRPDGGGKPANHRNLQDQANDPAIGRPMVKKVSQGRKKAMINLMRVSF